MDKMTLRDVDLKGKRVVMRVDFNVPMKEGVIKDDTRIQGALGSIRYVLDNGGSLVLMSHLGRPKGKGYEPEFSLKPVADYLAKCLDKPVKFVPDHIMLSNAVSNLITKNEVEEIVKDLNYTTSRSKSYANYIIPDNLFN